MSCICDVCGCETPSLIMGGLDQNGHALAPGVGRCDSCFKTAQRGEEKNCRNCLHRCMEPSDMNPYCSAVNRPFGLSLANRPRPTLCAGESGREYKLWEQDTRGHRGGG